MNLKAMGQRLRRLREARGLTQAELAKKARITREYVVRLEAGRYDPTLSVSSRLAKALGVPVTELLE
jgi:putative transcriptional regulator